MKKQWMNLAAMLLAGAFFCGYALTRKAVFTVSRKLREMYEAHAIGLTTVKNARHLGGYVGADGRVTRKIGMLRTAKLSELSDEEAAVLKNKWNLTTVVDFRSEVERSSEKDWEIDGVQDVNIVVTEFDVDLIARYLNKPLAEATRLDLLVAYGKADGGLKGLYAKLVTSERSHRGYRQFFDVLLASEGTVLWHCTEGKDRTGFAEALLLSALGVDRETVLDDYEASNVVYADAANALCAELVKSGMPKAESAAAAEMTTVSRSAMASALDLIATEFGGMDAFLHNQIGLTDEEITRLRDKYLE